MTSELRDKKQQEFADMYFPLTALGCKDILNLSPRFGKTGVGVKIIKNLIRHSVFSTRGVLIAYPDNKVKDEWEKEMERLNCSKDNITFTTHLSLKNHVKYFPLVIIDEIHLLSEAQMGTLKELQQFCPTIIGFTGTMSYWTEATLERETGMKVKARYSLEEAIRDGIVADYEINVVSVGLDTKKLKRLNGKLKSEKQQFDGCTHVIERLDEQGKDTKWMRFKRMRIIQNSVAKIEKTKELLAKFKNDRVLVFCGLIKVAESLGCPVFHSKTKDVTKFREFAEGKGNHMAVVKIGNTGVTYVPLKKTIINYFDSNEENLVQKINRAMSYDYSNPLQKAEIWIVTTDEPVEKKWLKKALSSLDPNKIKYL